MTDACFPRASVPAEESLARKAKMRSADAKAEISKSPRNLIIHFKASFYCRLHLAKRVLGLELDLCRLSLPLARIADLVLAFGANRGLGAGRLDAWSERSELQSVQSSPWQTQVQASSLEVGEAATRHIVPGRAHCKGKPDRQAVD